MMKLKGLEKVDLVLLINIKLRRFILLFLFIKLWYNENGENMNIEDIEVEKELKVVFMGTPDFSVPILEGLIDNYYVKAVITQPDKQVGRSGKLSMPPIKRFALDKNLLVIQPKSMKLEYQEIIDLEPDLIVTCAYGQILPKELLDYPKYGCINVHASLLPKLRGGAPIHKAIIEGYKKTGITIMHMAPGMDDGDIIAQKEVIIEESDTANTLHDKLKIVGRDLLLETLPSVLDGTAPRIKQDPSQVTYAFNIKPEEEKIDFSKSKNEIYNQIRGLNSWPGAYCFLEGKRLKIWESYKTDNYFSELMDGQITNVYKDGIGVKVSNGEIVITLVQLEGKNKMRAVDFANGFGKQNLIGKILA